MTQKILAANWKMNKTYEEVNSFISEFISLIKSYETETQILICSPYPYLDLLTNKFSNTDVKIGAQNVSEYEGGAYTGEVSGMILASLNVESCITGHSERRKYFGESDELILKKIKILLTYNITPIFCCGEVLSERNAGKHFDVVKNQIKNSIFELSEKEFKNIIIAYEPVWAIGTGVNATPEQAEEMHAFIRYCIKEKYGEKIAENTSILYGGSCNPKNAKELFSRHNVDGGLIGGASLNPQDFFSLIKISDRV